MYWFPPADHLSKTEEVILLDRSTYQWESWLCFMVLKQIFLALSTVIKTEFSTSFNWSSVNSCVSSALGTFVKIWSTNIISGATVLREPGTETSEFFSFSLEQEVNVSTSLQGSNSLDSTHSQSSNALPQTPLKDVLKAHIFRDRLLHILFLQRKHNDIVAVVVFMNSVSTSVCLITRKPRCKWMI